MKNFIRGCGTGILIATLILAIAYMLTDRDISDSEVIARAKKLGMTEADATVVRQQEAQATPEALQQEDGTGTEPAQDASRDNAGQAENVQDSAEPAEEGDSMSSVQEDSDSITSTEPPVPAVPSAGQAEVPDAAEAETISVTIRPGQDGVSISRMLQEKGVVADASDFNSYLSANRLQMDIRHGTFELQRNMSYEELVKKIVYSQGQ